MKVCAPISDSGLIEPPPPNTVIPIATPEIMGTPLLGNTITSSYLFDPNGGSGEGGGSEFYWLVYQEEDYPVVKECTNNEGSVCELNIENSFVDKTILSCVLPQSQDGVYGAIACANTKGIGIEMRGSFVYGDVINATVRGISGEASWRVDTSTKLGFNSDGEPTLAPGTEAVGITNGDTVSYTIGVNTLALDAGMDLNGDGEITDVEWLDVANDAPRASIGVDAGNFIGKDILFCVLTEEYGEICAAASDYDNPYDEEFGYCTTPDSCVAHGLYQSNAATLDDPVDLDTPINVTKLALTGKRGIEPIAEIELSGYVYHRPIFVSDFILREKKVLGNLPPPYRPINSRIEYFILSQFGEEITAYPTKIPTSQGVDYCSSFKRDNQWYLPVAGWVTDVTPASLDSGYQIVNDIFIAQGNNATTSYIASIFYLREQKLRGTTNQDIVDGYYSPAYGWDTSLRILTASNDLELTPNQKHLVSYVFTMIAPSYSSNELNGAVYCSKSTD